MIQIAPRRQRPAPGAATAPRIAAKMFLCLGLGLLTLGCSERGTSSSPEVAHAEDGAADPVPALRELFAETWQARLQRSPIMATYLGDRRYNARWDDMSEAAYAAELSADRAALERLGRIDRATLPESEQLNYDLFQRDLEERIARADFHGEWMPLDQLSGVHLLSQLTEFAPFETVADYENWLLRLQAYGRLVDQNIELMQRGIEQRRVRPQVVVKRVIDQVARQRVAKAEDSAYFGPFEAYPESIPEAVAAQLTLAAETVVAEELLPALDRLHKFLVEIYLPASPVAEVGLMHQPRGPEYYGWLVRHHTGSTSTADEIHALGLAEVKRLRDARDALMKQAGHASGAAEFKKKLSWNPRYRYNSRDALLDAYRATAKQIDPMLPQLFGKLPRTPYGVRRIAREAEASAPAAYYYPPAADGSRAGYFYVNTYKPKTRPGWEIDALTAHEAVPGHHLQIALAAELEDLPDFRRFGMNLTAFVEGWALYAESLGEELGLYTNYGTRFGQINFEMWRAVRLVVDTGLHAKGWSRERALEYFAQHVPKSSEEIEVEVDRYIAMPGQALAYKMGQLRIQALREHARERLGEDFDIREFHDRVLGQGALPMDMLEQSIENWIEERLG